jgi:hypothetical protein
MIKNGLIVFFYVDDIVFAYGKKHDVGDLRWFLGIIKKTINVAFTSSLYLGRYWQIKSKIDTKQENWSSRHKVTKPAARPTINISENRIDTLPTQLSRQDISFTVSRLAGSIKISATSDKYLYSAKNLCIQYDHENSRESFICASNSSFANSR